jgi:hypothetical protein
MALTDAQLLAQASVIKTETVAGANTANRVGLMLEDIVDNKINDDKIDVDGTLAANSDLFVASQKATKTYVDALGTTVNASIALKENAANKSNAPLTNSALLFPTSGAVKTYVDTADALKEDLVNKSRTQSDFITNGLSADKYPSNVAVKGYIDSTTAGLLRDAGNFTPSPTSPGNLYPTVGSGPAGAVAQGDTYFIDTPGFFGTDPVGIGASIRALVAAPASPSGWSVLDASLGIVPEDSANKSNDGTFNAGTPSSVEFPTQFAVATYIAANPVASDLQSVLAAGHTLTNGRNFQGDSAGAGQSGFNVNAFGGFAASNNFGTNINAFGEDAGANNALGGSNLNAFGSQAAQNNTGTNVNAFGNAAGLNNTYSSVNLFGNGATADAPNQLVFSNVNGDNARFDSTNISADRNYELPDQSGTIALLSDIPTGVQTAIVDIFQAALAAGGTIPLIPAPGAGFVIQVLGISAVLFVTTPFVSVPTPVVSFIYGSSSPTIAYATILYGNTSFSIGTLYGGSSAISTFENQPLNMFLATPPTGGSNILRVTIQYVLVNVA